MKPIFQNNRTYDVGVATPSGAGRIIPPGYCAEGDYFISSWRDSRQLTRLTDEEVKLIDRRKILVSISTTGNIPNSVQIPQEAISPFVPETMVHVPGENQSMPEHLNETKKSIGESITSALKQLTEIPPTTKEVDKLPTEELLKLAKELDISGSGRRSDLIKMIKEKLAAQAAQMVNA